MHSEKLEEGHWLREIDRGNAPGLPKHIIEGLEREGLARGEGLLTVLTDAGRARLNAVRDALGPAR